MIWLGVSVGHGSLVKLQKSIEAATRSFGKPAEDRDFHPHLTIGRLKAGIREARHVGVITRNHCVPDLPEWGVRTIELIQSTLSPQGSTYRSLAVLPLGKT